MYPTYISKASRRDLDNVFDLVNETFKMEVGDEGVAYRNCERYELKDHARKHLNDMLVLKDHRRVRGDIWRK